LAAPTETLDFRDFEGFYAWLRDHHASEPRAHLLIYKKGYRDRGISYDDAVRAALCWGWVDSITWRRDEVTFIQRFTPRKPDSYWAASNIRRMRALIDAGRMTDAGMVPFDVTLLDRIEEVEAAERARREASPELPAEARALLEADPEALARFERLPPSHRRQFVSWIDDAKRAETKLRRTRKMIRLLHAGLGPIAV